MIICISEKMLFLKRRDKICHSVDICKKELKKKSTFPFWSLGAGCCAKTWCSVTRHGGSHIGHHHRHHHHYHRHWCHHHHHHHHDDVDDYEANARGDAVRPFADCRRRAQTAVSWTRQNILHPALHSICEKKSEQHLVLSESGALLQWASPISKFGWNRAKRCLGNNIWSCH